MQRSGSGILAPTNASVDTLFREAEADAEYTIGWIRIAIGLALFGSSLLVSAGAPELSEEYRLGEVRYTGLITVGAFLALGIISLVLVICHWFRPWMAFVLVAGDAAILGISLFFALDGAGLDGNSVAALPTIWLLPLSLAVGALRYSPLVQLWATAATMVALFGVVSALGFHSFPDSLGIKAVPSDLEAAISHLFSLPPYLMRAVMLTLVGLTLALAVLRSRRLLIRTVNETTRRASLARFLPAEIAPLVGESGIATWRQGRRQQATILFVDIRGFTAYAEGMDPARISIFISSFRRRVMRSAEEFGGVVDKFIGDGALLIFGVPDPLVDDCTRAIACAHKLHALVDQWNAKRGFRPPIRVGIGIHTGEVYCGLVGDDKRLEFTVLGDVVNVAAKIEQATKWFGALLLASETVVMRSGQLSEWREVGHEPLGGRGEHLAIFAYAGTMPKS